MEKRATRRVARFLFLEMSLCINEDSIKTHTLKQLKLEYEIQV